MRVSQWSFNVRTHCQRGHALVAENIYEYRGGRRECRLCIKWRRRHDAAFEARTHCPHGHRYTKGTLYVGPDGKRRCALCRAMYNRRDTCKARCRRKQVDQGLCATHLALALALDEEYGAYWRAEGYYNQ